MLTSAVRLGLMAMVALTVAGCVPRIPDDVHTSHLADRILLG